MLQWDFCLHKLFCWIQPLTNQPPISLVNSVRIQHAYSNLKFILLLEQNQDGEGKSSNCNTTLTLVPGSVVWFTWILQVIEFWYLCWEDRTSSSATIQNGGKTSPFQRFNESLLVEVISCQIVRLEWRMTMMHKNVHEIFWSDNSSGEWDGVLRHCQHLVA